VLVRTADGARLVVGQLLGELAGHTVDEAGTQLCLSPQQLVRKASGLVALKHKVVDSLLH
jgi:hypothetical protein